MQRDYLPEEGVQVGSGQHVRAIDLLSVVEKSPDGRVVNYLIEGYSQKWIAERLGVSPATISRRIRLLRQSLEEKLRD